MTDPLQDPGVQGLAQIGCNAIERVTELERGIAYRDQMIRQLSEELDDLIKTDNETLQSLFAEQAKRDETIRQLRAQIDEYERAPTVATVFHGIHGTSWEPYIRESEDVDLPPPGTELIARPR